jgi:[acyl-carrier-protein] S-malonyltransferase
VAAGTLAFDDAVKLVRQRGRYMQQAVSVGRGAMAAVLGGELEAIERACAETEGVVEPVNYNCPGQLVIAGAKEAVERASAAVRSAGAKVRLLPVSAPFHSSLMKPAEDELRPHLEQTTFRDPTVPVYVNVDAAPVSEAAAARDALVRQVSRAVRWEQTMRRMLEDGVTLFVEIGPGKVLTGMLKRIDRDAATANVENPDDFAAALEAISAHRG